MDHCLSNLWIVVTSGVGVLRLISVRLVEVSEEDILGCVRRTLPMAETASTLRLLSVTKLFYESSICEVLALLWFTCVSVGLMNDLTASQITLKIIALNRTTVMIMIADSPSSNLKAIILFY